MNSIHLIGRLTKAPRYSITSNDKSRVNFTLAVDGTTGPDYVPVTCFEKLAESVAEYTDKGHLVAIEGRLSTGKYTNDAGETIYTMDVAIARCDFLKAPGFRGPVTGSASDSEVAPQAEVA